MTPRALAERALFADCYNDPNALVSAVENVILEAVAAEREEVVRLRKALVKVYEETGNCPLCNCHEHEDGCALAD